MLLIMSDDDLRFRHGSPQSLLRNHPMIIAPLRSMQVQLTTTAINVEEQLRGRLAQVAEARDCATKSTAYQRLVETVMLLSEFNILQYDAKSHEVYQLNASNLTII